MSHEHSQPDMPDRHLLEIDTQPRVGTWTEIGKAEITHTFFGKAKVRIVRKHDKTRHARLLMAIAVTVLAVAGWQGWIASHQAEPQPADLSSAVSATAQPVTPAAAPEITVPPALPAVESKPQTPPAEISKPAIVQKTEPRQSPGLKGDEQAAAKPPKLHSAKSSQPQTEQPATDNSAPKNLADKPLSPRLSSPNQPVATAAAIAPATKQVAQPAASSPVAIYPPVAPQVWEGNTKQSPAGNIQPSDPVNSPSK